MLEKFNRVMAFFRITDAYDQNLSITSLAMYVSLFKLATTSQASYTDIGALLVTLSAHTAKKFLNQKNNEPADTAKGE